MRATSGYRQQALDDREHIGLQVYNQLLSSARHYHTKSYLQYNRLKKHKQ